MSRLRRPIIFAAAFAAVWLTGLPVLRAQDRLTPAQEARLKKYLPRTYAKFQRRESVRVVVTGDSISTFYQPEGMPRYDSGMAWEGRLLSRLSSYFSYHDTVIDVEPHREITASQKKSAAEWDKYKTLLEAWEKTKKGPAPEAPDTFRFRADAASASPAVMNVGELVRRGLSAARQPEEGTAVLIYNMARDGAQASQVLESLTTEAFPPAPAAGPDLVTICYGMNDALAGSPLSGYRVFLEQAVKICQARGADVLLAAPPVSFDPAHPRESLGRARPYAMVAREVAEAAGVYCVDLGAANVWGPSDLFNLTASNAFAAALAPVRRQFAYGAGITETLHPNSAAALRMGDLAAQELLGKSLRGPIEVTGTLDAGKAGKTDGTEAELSLRLFNPTDAPRSAVASLLSFPGWEVKPGTAAPDALFNLAPGKARRMKIPMVRTDRVRSGESGGFVRGSVLLSDDDTQQIVDVRMREQPLSLMWPEGRVDKASGDVLLNTTLTNTGAVAVKGTARVRWMNRTAELPVSLEAGQNMTLPVRLALPETEKTARFLEKVTVSIETGAGTVVFDHKVEGVKYVTLEQRLPMIPLNQGTASAPENEPEAAGSWLTVRADPDGVWFFLEVPSTVMPARQEGRPWGAVEVQLDGRNAAENGTPGFVDRLTADIPWEDGEAPVRPVRPAVFGNGYHFNYNPGSFRSRVTTRADGGRRIEFAIMRSNLALHEWSLDGSGQNSLGFNVRLTVKDADGNPDTAKSSAVTLTDFAATDARSLTVLELSRTPSPRWSLRIF
ncbi:MAG: GDSL-type esterase/lipase family protein [Verrucomicrobiota bacterium]